MEDMMLPFFIGTVTDFEECGIATSDLRHSIDGTKAVIHMQSLTIEQFDAVRTKISIEALTYEQTQALMSTSEWDGQSE